MTWILCEGDCQQILPTAQFRYNLVHFDPPYFSNPNFEPRDERLRSYRGQQPKHQLYDHGIDWSLLSHQFNRLLVQDGALGIWGLQPHLATMFHEYFAADFDFYCEFVWVKTIASLVINRHRPLPNHEVFWVLVKHGENGSRFSLDRTAKRKGWRPFYGKNMQRLGGPRNNKTYGRPSGKGRTPIGEEYLTSGIYAPPIHKGNPEYIGHPTQKPLNLTQRLLSFLTLPGDYILDPMAGTGTTLLAAEMIGRNSFGAELNPDYCRLIVDRLRGYNGSFKKLGTPIPA